MTIDALASVGPVSATSGCAARSVVSFKARRTRSKRSSNCAPPNLAIFMSAVITAESLSRFGS